MTAPLCRLLARHLRLQRDLLALARQTAESPDPAQPGDAARWVAQRQPLLDRLSAHDAPGLAAETVRVLDAEPAHPLSGVLTTLCERQIAVMQRISSRERLIRSALQMAFTTIGRRLLSARRAFEARETYHARGREDARPRGKDTPSPLRLDWRG
jgi:hypothetical protein